MALASPTIVFGCTRTPISSSVSASVSRRRLMSASICAGVLVSDVLDVSDTALPPWSWSLFRGRFSVRSTVCQLGTPPHPRHPHYARVRIRTTVRKETEPMSERLQPGDTAPAFTLPDADGNEVSLADHKGRKVIVYFYPAALTPGCTKQACDFTDNLDAPRRRGLRRHRRLPGQAREARQVPREGEPQGHPPRRPRQDGPRGLRRLRREEDLRQDRTSASSAPRSSWTRRARSNTPSTT